MSAPIHRRQLGLLAVMGASLLLVALGTASRASAATIYACEKKKGGTIRIVSAKAKCNKKTETKISWNTQGPAGPAGKNGANGTNGGNGKDGTNGAVSGYSASKSESITITSATSSSPQTILSKSLPAGSYIVGGKVELVMTATGAKAYGSITCTLTDTPTTGTAVADSSTWASSITVPVFLFDLETNVVPLQMAVSTGSNASTLTLSCYVGASYGGESSGVFSASAGNAVMTAVQTTQNS